jgi:hypothetical protein
VNPKLLLFILFVLLMAGSAYFVLPHRPATALTRGAEVDLVDSNTESPDHADGFKAGDYIARKPDQHDLSPVELKVLAAEEARKAGSKNAADWQSGFEEGFKKAKAKAKLAGEPDAQ